MSETAAEYGSTPAEPAQTRVKRERWAAGM